MHGPLDQEGVRQSFGNRHLVPLCVPNAVRPKFQRPAASLRPEEVSTNLTGDRHPAGRLTVHDAAVWIDLVNPTAE